MSTGITVVKVGGNQLDDAAWVESLAVGLARRGGATVVVHGGGRAVTALQRALGVEPEWRDGLRVTTPESVTAVVMALSGAANKLLVRTLVGVGVDALGVSGEDASLLRARVRDAGALGRTGEIVAVREELLRRWLAAGLVPVISPVSRGEDGGPLNVNADAAAAAVARALPAAELLFISDIPGVLRDGARVPVVRPGDARDWIAAGAVSGGMIPKLRAALSAAGEVARIRIGPLGMLSDESAGTMLVPAVDNEPQSMREAVHVG